MSAGISEALFADICEAVDLSDLHRACEWTRQATARLRHGPPISLKDFGGPPYRDLTFPGWRNGIDAVELLRQRLKLPMDPRQALRRMFDDPETGELDRVPEIASGAVEGVARRENFELRATVPARSIKQKNSGPAERLTSGGAQVQTPKLRSRQPRRGGNRLAEHSPQSFLLQRNSLRIGYGKTGLNRNSVARLSSEWLCPEQIIVHQAKNNDIAVKGVEHAAVF